MNLLPQMKMKNIFSTCLMLPLLACSMSINAYAQSMSQKVDIDQVTVFLRGAELFNSSSFQLPEGESEVVFSNVAGNMNEQSLSISADNGVMVLSRTVRHDYLVEEVYSPRAKELQDELDAAEVKRQLLQVQQSVANEQLILLQKNSQLVQGDGVMAVDELEKMFNFVGRTMSAILEEQNRLNHELTELNKDIAKLSQQLNEEQNKGYQPGGQVIVKFYAPKAVTTNVRMSYVVNNAGWVPAYDLHVPKMNEPVQLTYKANVFQNTGIQWEKVNLTLSTGNPSQGIQAPTLSPWHLSAYDPQVLTTVAAYETKDMLIVADKAMKPMGSSGGSTTRYVANNTLDGYVSTNASGINTTFDIAIPYTVPSDGKGHMVLVQNAQVPAEYEYMVIPKLDPDTFLQARITDWKSLNILPGQTNVYYENSFIGQGYVSVNQVKDGLTFSLGRDKRIIVERIEDKNNTGSAGMFGGSTEKSFAYTIKLHNTRSDAVKLVVLDQIPVSQDEKITLENLKLASGVHNKNTGEVKWTIDLKSDEKKDITYSYTVKYPKEMTVNGL